MFHCSCAGSDLPAPSVLIPRLLPSPGVALLESASFHSAWGRYSYLGIHSRCALTITAAGQVQCEGKDLADLPEHANDPISVWHDAVQRFDHQHHSDDSDMNGCRWIGFFSYDLARFIENLPSIAADDLQWPLLLRPRATTLDASCRWNKPTRG